MLKYFLLAILLLLPVFAACSDDDDDDDATVTQTTSASTETNGPIATETTAATDTATATAEPTVADVCPENTDPATADEVQVDQPAPGDSSATPLHVEGLIAVFEAQFNISIIDAGGNYIVENMPAMSSEGQTLAPFSVDVPFVVTEETVACLQVYDISNADGTTLTDIVQVPVTLLP